MQDLQQYLIQTPVASLIFAITVITSIMAFNSENLMHKLILHPYSVYRKKEPYTVITSGLIHNDWMHLIFNMFSYIFFAFPLEMAMGHWQFGLLYVASLILSDIPTIFKNKNNYNYQCLGASGAVSAVIFAMILYTPGGGIQIFPIPFTIPNIIFGPLYLLYCYYASKHARDNVNHDAHMYGALSGLIIAIALYPPVVHDFINGASELIQYYLHQ